MLTWGTKGQRPNGSLDVPRIWRIRSAGLGANDYSFFRNLLPRLIRCHIGGVLHSFQRYVPFATSILLIVWAPFILVSCGGSPVSVTSAASAPVPTNGDPGTPVKLFSNLQTEKGWTGSALLPAAYTICSDCSPSGPQATWSMTQQVSTPSISGNSAQMDIGGQTAFSDILWNNHLIGDFSSQDAPDPDHSVVATLHNFIYDVYFYSADLSKSQALEFDINQFVGGQSYIWGHECRIAGGNEWDIWDNQNQAWIPTGVACNPANKTWNHVTIQVQRTDQDQLLFQSITLNGQKSILNHSENPTSSNWHGITINYQQDGNRSQEPYSVWLDNLTFSYW